MTKLHFTRKSATESSTHVEVTTGMAYPTSVEDDCKHCHRLRNDFLAQAEKLKTMVRLGPTPERIVRPKNTYTLKKDGTLGSGEVETLKEPGKSEGLDWSEQVKNATEGVKRPVFTRKSKSAPAPAATPAPVKDERESTDKQPTEAVACEDDVTYGPIPINGKTRITITLDGGAVGDKPIDDNDEWLLNDDGSVKQEYYKSATITPSNRAFGSYEEYRDYVGTYSDKRTKTQLADAFVGKKAEFVGLDYSELYSTWTPDGPTDKSEKADYDLYHNYEGKVGTIIELAYFPEGGPMVATFGNCYWNIQFEDGKVLEDVAGDYLDVLEDGFATESAAVEGEKRDHYDAKDFKKDEVINWILNETDQCTRFIVDFKKKGPQKIAQDCKLQDVLDWIVCSDRLNKQFKEKFCKKDAGESVATEGVATEKISLPFNKREKNYIANKDVVGVRRAMHDGSLARSRGRRILDAIGAPVEEDLDFAPATDAGKPIDRRARHIDGAPTGKNDEGKSVKESISAAAQSAGSVAVYESVAPCKGRVDKLTFRNAKAVAEACKVNGVQAKVIRAAEGCTVLFTERTAVPVIKWYVTVKDPKNPATIYQVTVTTNIEALESEVRSYVAEQYGTENVLTVSQTSLI